MLCVLLDLFLLFAFSAVLFFALSPSLFFCASFLVAPFGQHFLLLLFFSSAALACLRALRAADVVVVVVVASHSNAPKLLIACRFCGFCLPIWQLLRLASPRRRLAYGASSGATSAEEALPPLSYSWTGLICMRNMSKLLWSIHWLLFMYLWLRYREREGDRKRGSSAHVVAAARFVWHPQIFMTMFELGRSRGEGKERGRGRVETWVHSARTRPILQPFQPFLLSLVFWQLFACVFSRRSFLLQCFKRFS